MQRAVLLSISALLGTFKANVAIAAEQYNDGGAAQLQAEIDGMLEARDTMLEEERKRWQKGS